MKLVADANILFSLVNPKTSASELVKLHNIKLFSPSFAFGELAKYKSEIEKKSKISFDKTKETLKQHVSFIKESDFSPLFKQFKDFIDEKDIPYLALSLSLNLPIWSNDPHLKQQSSIRVFTTEELINILE
ncbi:MAG: PIN domain-containing protein [Nanoarchaeota archaeon]